MTIFLLLLAATLLGLSYYGAGLLLYPPKMSAMTIFPERFGLAYEKVSLRAADGLRLAGWFIASPTGEDKTLLLCHGWGDNKGELLEHTLFLNAQGFNLLYFDFRGHGESEASVVTMGKLELLDLAAAVAFLKTEKPACAARLGIFGQSMGAAVAALGLCEHPEIRAAVLESPFADFHEVGGRWAWRHARVPYFPVLNLLMLWVKLRSGHADVDLYHPEDRIGRGETPVFFIASACDELMRPSDVRRLYDKARGPKEFWSVPGAQHAKGREAAPADYDAKVGAFLRRHLDPLPVTPSSKGPATLGS